jgi:hypothetical protein
VSTNRYLPHLFVLPEDDANKELATGFLLRVYSTHQVRVLPVAGGWNQVLERFKSERVREMENYSKRFMVLLIDFDGRPSRLETAKAAIPEHLADRVFVLGAWSRPEDLKRELGAYERIGSLIADDCRQETNATWGHDLLRHNAAELQRLCEHVGSILFLSPQR